MVFKKRGNTYLLLFIFVFSIALSWLTSFTKNPNVKNTTSLKEVETDKQVTYSIALLADSHLDYQLLDKALKQAKKLDVDYVIHLGDLSDYGGVDFLQKSKSILDSSGLDYLVIPGDRDIIKNGVESTIKDSPFTTVFLDHVCSDQLILKYKILCLSNPGNYQQISGTKLSSFYNNLPQVDVVITSQPIYNSVSDQYMGIYDSKVLDQALQIIQRIEGSGTKLVISADTHFSNHYFNNDIEYYTIGAISKQRNIQQPNFSVLYKYVDGTYSVAQINIE